MSEPISSLSDTDLRGNLPRPADQGPRPLCLAFAVTGAHDASCLGDGESARAVEALWNHCVRNGRAEAAGTTLAAVLDAVAMDGQPCAVDWPFNPVLGVGTESPPEGCGERPWRTARFRELPLAHDGVERGIEQELAQDRCVVLVLEIGDEFTLPNADGFVAVPDLSSDMGDYHAVLAVGAVSAASGRHLIVRNSWGSGWGVEGHCLLPMEYLAAFAVQAAGIAPD